MLSPPAIAAECSTPDGIELLDERFDECWIVGHDAVLEVTLAF